MRLVFFLRSQGHPDEHQKPPTPARTPPAPPESAPDSRQANQCHRSAREEASPVPSLPRPRTPPTCPSTRALFRKRLSNPCLPSPARVPLHPTHTHIPPARHHHCRSHSQPHPPHPLTPHPASARSLRRPSLPARSTGHNPHPYFIRRVVGVSHPSRLPLRRLPTLLPPHAIRHRLLLLARRAV